MLLQCGDERFERADAAGRGVRRDGLMRLPECHLQQHPLLELEPGDLRQPRPGERIGGRRAEDVHGLLGAVVCPAPAVDDALLRQRRRPAGRVRVEPARDARTRQRHVIHGKGAVMNLVSSTSTPRGARVRFGGHVGRVRGCAVGRGTALQRAVSAAAASLPAKVERAHPGRHFKVALHYCPMVHCSDE